VGDPLVRVEADAALSERRVLGLIEPLAVERDAQNVAGSLKLAGVPLASRLVEAADALDLVPRLVFIRADEDRLGPVEMDIVAGAGINGADDEAAGQHSLGSRLDHEPGPQRHVAPLVRQKDRARHLLAPVEHELAAADRGGLVEQQP